MEGQAVTNNHTRKGTVPQRWVSPARGYGRAQPGRGLPWSEWRGKGEGRPHQDGVEGTAGGDGTAGGKQHVG